METTNPTITAWTDEKVKSLVQSIYSEFAELPPNMKSTASLRHIMEIEVEQHPLHPIPIFVKSEMSKTTTKITRSEEEFYECQRCEIDSKHKTRACPCPRGGCEAKITGMVKTTTVQVTTLNK